MPPTDVVNCKLIIIGNQSVFKFENERLSYVQAMHLLGNPVSYCGSLMDNGCPKMRLVRLSALISESVLLLSKFSC